MKSKKKLFQADIELIVEMLRLLNRQKDEWDFFQKHGCNVCISISDDVGHICTFVQEDGDLFVVEIDCDEDPE